MKTGTITMTDDKAVPMLAIGHNADSTFCVIDTLDGVHIILDGFKTKAEARQYIEDFHLELAVIEPLGSEVADEVTE